MNSKYIKNRHLWQVIALLGMDALWFGSTNAVKVPSFMIMVGFGLLVISLYYLVYAIISLAGLYGLHAKRKLRLSLYITGMISGLVALQSVGELGGRDVQVLLPLAILGYLYSSYAKNQARNLGT